MKRKILVAVVTVLGFSSARSQSQAEQTGMLKQVMQSLKERHSIAYSYNVSGVFPNGQTDKRSGEVYVDYTSRLFYSNDSIQTMVLTGNEYFCANHKARRAVVINTLKDMSAEQRRQIESTYLQNNIFNKIIDSVVLKYGQITKYEDNHDTIGITLSFKDDERLKSMAFRYNKAGKIVFDCSMILFDRWRDAEFGRNAGTTYTLHCFNLRTVSDPSRYMPGNFFTITNGTIQLKKFNTYKLTTKI